jgi:hypothetical protein
MEHSCLQEEELSKQAAGLVDLVRRSLGEMSERQRLAGFQGLRTRLQERHRARRTTRWIALAVFGASAGVIFVAKSAMNTCKVSVASDAATPAAGSGSADEASRPCSQTSVASPPGP